MCLKHVEKYIMASEVELQSALSTDGFHCRVDGCDRSYIHHSARVKHEDSQHGLVKDRY
ncbi:unnamed protein product [Porites lobata]|uniref:C2H2-type domain-containing protein n=1 Tax=Porites lobata TaxID=104759 RepID=A0ABN8QGC5_9CNID|nr:unnamed protein product [Porites lobata]